jgi:uncharacterized protein (TIGR00369 family)
MRQARTRADGDLGEALERVHMAFHRADSNDDVARAWFEHSPMIGLLGLRIESMAADEAIVELPFQERVVTAGDVIHGGAIMSLIDTAAVMAAWSAHDPSKGVRWGTVGASVSFLSPGRGSDLRAVARISRRGRGVCFCRVEVADADGAPIAEGLVTYRLG